MITKEAPWLIAAFCSVSLLACASEPPEPAMAQKTETVTAKVVAVDTDKRLLMLQGPEDVVPIEVPESVSNLESVKVGDELAVTYYAGVAAVFAEQTRGGNSSDNKDVLVTTGAVNTPAGVPPGRAVGKAVTARVKIQTIDRDFQTVTFTGPSGMTRMVGVNDPKMQAFVAKLKPGDEVDVTYYEALAARVVPASR
ncbi:MAG TPA: hypothetical protein VJS42_01275 [Steroidobacteraceae bacterium]|nr:hypothetical protein [Steroidobacteraceae bacterium]